MTLRFCPLLVNPFHLEVERPMVGREEDGLERSLVEAARWREELGRDVGLSYIKCQKVFKPAHVFTVTLKLVAQKPMERRRQERATQQRGCSFKKLTILTLTLQPPFWNGKI